VSAQALASEILQLLQLDFSKIYGQIWKKRKTRAADPAGMPPKKKTARRRSLKERYRVLSRDQEKKRWEKHRSWEPTPETKKGDALVKEIGNLRRP